MPTELTFPDWGVGDEEGRVIRWLKREGDRVSQGEPIAEIESAKVTAEVESPASGVVSRIAVADGASAKAGDLLATIDEEASSPASPASQPHVPQTDPAVRRLAEAYGIDLNQIEAGGEKGKVQEASVRALIDGETAPETRQVPLVGMRRTIADRLYGSLQSTAQVTINTEADATESEQLRRDLVSRWRSKGVRPMALALLIKASARALSEHPRLNATMNGETITLHKHVNVGFAVGVEAGLVVPVIKLAEQKPLIDISREARELVLRALSDQLSPAEMADGTFTITSMGAYDVDTFTPITNPPQVAILGTGRLVEKPVVHNGEITKRSMIALSLTFDHRAIDGVPAGQLLKAIKQYLEQPGWLVE